VLIGAAVGFVIGFVGSIIGFTAEEIRPIASTVGGLIGIAWALVVVRMLLAKRFKDFRLALVPVTAP